MSEPAQEAPARKLPALDRETGFFWTGGAQGRLMIQRCGACGRYQHPPLPLCSSCRADAMAPAPVSGRGVVATFTINHEPWLPGLDAPFVFAAIELEEQRELYVFSNVLARPERVRAGLLVAVVFEQHDTIWLPLFAASEGAP